VAAFIAEPVAVPQAIKVPPDDYWPRVQEICRRHGVLLIVDEVFNGFGRTGKLFGSNHWSIEPDLMVVSKGLTSGYVPLSAAIATRSVFEAFWGKPELALQHGGTYSGHPVGCAAALANLGILAREQLVDRAREQGAALRRGLDALAERPFVGNVSGIGLLLSVELVVDRRSKRPAPPAIGHFLRQRMIERGVIVRCAYNTIYFHPPLVIGETELREILTCFAGALEETAKRFADEWRPS
jgi:4-aminobutyrate---pyruvate transaminase